MKFPRTAEKPAVESSIQWILRIEEKMLIKGCSKHFRCSTPPKKRCGMDVTLGK